MNEKEIYKIIAHYSKKLHEHIGATIDLFITDNNLPEDAVTLSIVFNAISNNLQAIVENNNNIPAESVELLIHALTTRLRKAYRQRSK